MHILLICSPLTREEQLQKSVDGTYIHHFGPPQEGAVVFCKYSEPWEMSIQKVD